MVADSLTYQTRPFPRSRRLVIDSSNWGRRHHTIHVLAEFDVTEARQLVHAHAAATGEKLSFTAYIAACIGRAVATDRNWHAYRKGRKLILFDDVDIGILIDHEVEHERLATLFVIRAAQAKCVRDIHEEIRAAQRERIENVAGVDRWWFFLSLPGFLRRLFYWWLDLSPATRKRYAGTVLLTAPGMFGKGGGWGVPTTLNTLTITTGGVATKPGVVRGEIVPREYMDVTISFDHDVVDGGPAARFASCFREIVESASLLADIAALPPAHHVSSIERPAAEQGKAMAMLQTAPKLGIKAPPFRLPGTDGRTYSLADVAGKNGTVVAFICNHCPYVKAVVGRMVADARALAAEGIGFVAISANDATGYPEDSFANMKLFAEVHGLPFPYLYDESQAVARAYDAVCTPEFYGLSAAGTIEYHGRLDEGRKEPPSSDAKRELLDAMRMIARTGKGPSSQIASVGCSIKWKAA